MTTITMLLSAFACFLVFLSNWQDPKKRMFSGVVLISLILGAFIDSPTQYVHAASIVYNAIIFLLLWSVKCAPYNKLCYLYAISILNEVVMLSSRVFAGDSAFAFGDNFSVAIMIVLVVALASRSDGTKGLRSLVRHLGDYRRPDYRSNDH